PKIEAPRRSGAPKDMTPFYAMAVDSHTRLHGGWVLVARLLWALAAVVVLALFAASIGPHYDQLLNFSSNAIANPQAVPTGLAELGLSIESFATYLVVVKVVFTAIFTTIAGIIFWRRGDDWMALLLSLALLAFGATFPGTLPALNLAYPSLAGP